MRIVHFKRLNLLWLGLCLYVLPGLCSATRIGNSQNSIRNSINLKRLSPVIFIPGLGGNRLQAKLNKTSVPHAWCSKNSDYFDIWVNFFELFPDVIDCWIDNMRLTYDNVTRKTKNTPGVEIKLPKWGRTEAIEWLDTTPIIDHLDSGAYFYHISHAMTNRGYARGKTIFGAPYDFRKGPNENEDWFERLIHLTEHAYKINNNTSVTYIVHSLGGKMLLYFLQQMPNNWKDQYVKQAITISSPFGGSVQAIVALSVGDNLNSKMLNTAKMKEVQKTFPSIAWAMPSKYFWKSNEILTTINNKNYTLDNIDQYFNDIGIPNINEMRKDQSEFNSFQAPGVEMHCLYGSHIDTADRLNFGRKFNLKPLIVKGNGDGVVNVRSLIGCGYWQNSPVQRNRTIYQQEFPGAEHIAILSSAASINYILKTLTGYEDYPRPDEYSSKESIN